MSSETYFLQPVGSASNPINAEAIGSAQFFNYSQAASGSLNSADFQVLVQGGVAFAIANADSIFIDNPAFTDLFTETFAEGDEGAFEVESRSSTEVVATFEIDAHETFSFDFAADISLEATEIEDPDTAYSKAKSRIGFLVLDTTDVAHPEIVNFFGISGALISSENKGRASRGKGNRDVKISSFDVDKDIDGDNGEDFVNGFAAGTYEQTFNNATQITVIEINESFVKLHSDNLIGYLGEGVQYGTLSRDQLNGTNGPDKIYGSLLGDRLKGGWGNDILEGGPGNDRIQGNQDHDQLHGGPGEDTLVGGRGSDVLVGGDSADWFLFRQNQSLKSGELDVIKDFEVGVDKIEFQAWGSIDPNNWLSEAIANGDFVNTSDGAVYTSNQGGQLLFEGVSLDSLNSSYFVFT